MTSPQILVVEDDPIVAEEIQIILEQMKYTVVECVSSGEEAIERAAQKPDLVLMDITLKGEMDGVEAAQHIRTRFDIPIIYLTAYSDEVTLQRTKLTEPFGYVTKPFEAKDLRISIEMALYKHRLEKKLREREATFKAISTSAKDAIIMIDHEGHVSFWNKAAENIFGYTSDEVMGKNLHALLLPPADYETFQHAFKQFQRTGTGGCVNDTREMMAIRKDGTEVCTEVSLSAIEVQGTWHAIGIVRDITQRKHTEEQLRKLTQQLSEASTHKSNFLSSMSHELRTPLNAMIGYTSLTLSALKDKLPAEHLQNLTKAEQSARVLLQLINDVLDFSKLQAGRLETFIEPIDLIDVLEDVVVTAEGLLQGKPVSLTTDFSDDLPTVESDYTRLKQILDNLVSNAIKFTDKGQVSVRAYPVPEHSVVRVEVEDTGCGMSAQNVEGIFRLFQQIDGSITKKFGGTGLGLALTQKLSAMLGITVGVRSEEGQGTQFWLDIPLNFQVEQVPGDTDYQDEPTTPETPQPVLPDVPDVSSIAPPGEQIGGKALAFTRDPAPANTSEQAVAEPEAVLLCFCHDQKLCGTVTRHLTGVPMTLHAVASLEECLQNVQTLPVWAILVEAGHPDTLLRALRSEAALQHIPIITSSTEELMQGGENLVQALTPAKTRSILVVDDNEMNLDVLTGVFEAETYTVLQARSGQSGIELARTHTPDVILMDLAMPDMDGFAATRLLKQYPGTSEITIIACSAFATRQYKEKAFEVGCDGYITKPIEPGRIVEQVAKIALASKIRKKLER